MIIANRASAILYRFLATFPGGTYLLPANICPVVPLTFKKCGVSFEFIDINEETLCINEEAVIRAVSLKPGHYGGMVFVRTYGYRYDTSAFFSALDSLDPHFKIIDDKCLCFPDLSPIAPNVDMELFSTGKGKTVDMGYGGFARLKDGYTLNDLTEPFEHSSYGLLENIYKKALKEGTVMKDYPGDWLDARKPDFREDDYLIKVMQRMEEERIHKNRLNEVYSGELPGFSVLPVGFHDWRFNIITDQKEKIIDEIFRAGLFASSHYAPANRLFDQDVFPVAERLSKRVINLFNDFNLTPNEAERICSIIKKTV